MAQRIPQLDGARGIAILIVIFHNELKFLPSNLLQNVAQYGWMGVDLFFVLSGFLITGILFDNKPSPGYFRNFYARRCLRILPLYYAVLLLMFVALPLLRPSVGHMVYARSSPWWSYPVFLQNFLLHPSTNAAGPLGVTWSLAVEEEFYLVWALVVRFCSYAQLCWMAIAVILLSPVLRFYLSLHGVELYTNVFCRLDGLMAGGLLALVVRSKAFIPARYLKASWIALFIAVPAAVVTESLRARWMTFSLSAVASAAFLYLLLFAPQRWFQAVIGNRALVYTGTISYGLYLLHKLPFDVVELSHGDHHAVLALFVGLAASYALATASWFLFEKPVLKLERYFELRPRGLASPGGDAVANPS